jgi:ubiquinone/menaquinone biosynthesis C-methylase UbiE
MKEPLLAQVRRHFSSPEEIQRYQRKATNGLLAWERHVVKRYLEPRGTVLDIGCGAGREAFALHDLGYCVTGIDISSKQVRAARVMSGTLGKNVTFCICDGTTLNFPDASFRCVLLWSQALGNVPRQHNRLLLLKECARVLEPGGMLVSSVHNRDVCEALAQNRQLICDANEIQLEDGDLMVKDHPLSETCCFWHYFRKTELTSLHRDAGLHVIRCALAADLGQEGWNTIWISICRKGIRQ